MAVDVNLVNREPVERKRRHRSLAVRDAPIVPIGYFQFNAASFPALTTGQPLGFGEFSIPLGATTVRINVEAQSLRYRDDGGNPSPTVGDLYPAGSTFVVTLSDLGTIQLCAAAAGCIANVTFFGQYR